MTVQQAEWAKEIESGSSQLGMSTESYQQLDYVMQSVGYSMDQAKGDLSALAEKAQDAASGSGEAAEMFDRLGVSVTNTDGTMKSQAQLFAEVYNALAQMSDVTERNAIASNCWALPVKRLLSPCWRNTAWHWDRRPRLLQ